MELGAFSVSLNVADLDVSRTFYEALGFEVAGGDPDHNYLIMANGTILIGLFVGMFEGQVLTFNPGLNNNKEQLKEFEDVRSIEAKLKAAGVELLEEVETGTGAGHISLVDPDGHQILIDQFF